MVFGINTSSVDDVLGKAQGDSQGKPFSRELNIGDFDSFGGSVTSGKFTEVGRFTVPSDTEYSWGYGAAKHATNQGYLYVDLYDDATTPVEVEGTIRFTVQSSTGRRETVVADFDTSRLDASKTNKEQMVPFPEQGDLATEDAHLVVKLDPQSNTTVSSANSEVIIPATEYDLS